MDDPTAIVVIGEPDPATCALYLRTLGDVFTVLAAPNEAALVLLLQRNHAAVVVIEPALFQEHSWSQVELLAQDCATTGTPLVICSTQDERRRGFALGAAAYLVKPTLPVTLLETLRQLLSSRMA